MKTDERLDLLVDWVSRFDGLAGARPEPASADASFRRYFRVRNGGSYIVMDAPPAQEDCRRFVAVAGYLESMGLNSPRVVEADLERGFLLLTDLGSTPYLSVIDVARERAEALYRDAIDALLVMQSKGATFQQALPPYDDKLLRLELSLFHDWLCEKHLAIRFGDDDERAWRSTCDVLVEAALAQPKVFVHRDYHSRNLMVTSAANPGILDFQDAVEGPYTYDLVSLLKDCYVRAPRDVIDARARYFLDRSGHIHAGEAQFRRDFDLMGVQRHLKAAGIFARLLHRDGKTGYLKDAPRTLSYVVDVAAEYDELRSLGEFIRERVLPALGEPG